MILCFVPSFGIDGTHAFLDLAVSCRRAGSREGVMEEDKDGQQTHGVLHAWSSSLTLAFVTVPEGSVKLHHPFLRSSLSWGGTTRSLSRRENM